jgi:hypothetical protein
MKSYIIDIYNFYIISGFGRKNGWDFRRRLYGFWLLDLLDPLLLFAPGHRCTSFLKLRQIIENLIIIAFLARPDMSDGF